MGIVSLTAPGASRKIDDMWNYFVEGCLNLIYPPHCLICRQYAPRQQPHELLCPSCQSKIALNRPPFCQKCSRHLKGPHPSPLCQDCVQFHPAFDFAWSACLFQEPLRSLLHQFKYHQKTQMRHLLVHLMNTFISTQHLDIAQFDALLPIPLHATRKRERGYNQSALLAQGLAREWQIPLAKHILKRTQPTPSQTHLHQKERWTNLHEAFTMKPFTSLKGRSILIIDDLLTTGATTSHAAKVLKQAGAKTVGVLTVAIAE